MKDGLNLKEHLEIARNQMGPDWLQTLQTTNQIAADDRVANDIESNVTHGIPGTDDELYLNEECVQINTSADDFGIIVKDGTELESRQDNVVVNKYYNKMDTELDKFDGVKPEQSSRLTSMSGSDIEINWKGSQSENNVVEDYGE